MWCFGLIAYKLGIFNRCHHTNSFNSILILFFAAAATALAASIIYPSQTATCILCQPYFHFYITFQLFYSLFFTYMFLSTGAYAYAYIPTWSIETLSHLVTRDLTHQTHQTHTQQEEAYTIIMTTWVPVIMQPLSWVVVKCVYWPWINGTLNAWLYVHVHVCVWVWVMYVCVCVCVCGGVYFFVVCLYLAMEDVCMCACVCVWHLIPKIPY